MKIKEMLIERRDVEGVCGGGDIKNNLNVCAIGLGNNKDSVP